MDLIITGDISIKKSFLIFIKIKFQNQLLKHYSIDSYYQEVKNNL